MLIIESIMSNRMIISAMYMFKNVCGICVMNRRICLSVCMYVCMYVRMYNNIDTIIESKNPMNFCFY